LSGTVTELYQVPVFGSDTRELIGLLAVKFNARDLKLTNSCTSVREIFTSCYSSYSSLKCGFTPRSNDLVINIAAFTFQTVPFFILTGFYIVFISAS
jgi:hypothetical protein